MGFECEEGRRRGSEGEGAFEGAVGYPVRGFRGLREEKKLSKTEFE